LIATGLDGQPVRQQVTVGVKAPPPPPPPPKIFDFRAERSTIRQGEETRLCYVVADATQVRVEPGVGRLQQVDKDCVPVTPARSSTYTLIATGVGGQPVRQQVTVEVAVAPEPRIRPAPGGSNIRNFRAVSVSDREIEVTVEYTYTGEFGTNEVPITAVALQGDGSAVPGMVYPQARATVGEGRAVLRLYADLQRGRYTSTAMRICLVDTSRRTRPYCEMFSYEKTWVGSGTAVPRGQNDIRTFMPFDVSDTELRVTVDYTYDGSRGVGTRYIYMAAIALQSDGNQVPGTHFEGLGGPGEVRVGDGRTTMLITKRSRGTFTSTAVNVCLIAREPPGELLCKRFPHMKVWR